MEGGLALGIDLGTTNIKVTLTDIATEEKVFGALRPTHGIVESDAGPLGAEQSSTRILKVLEECVRAIPVSQQIQIAGIAVTGQQHGLVMWRSDKRCKVDPQSGSVIPGACSNLYTWQDGRCSEDFLSTLPKPDSHSSLYSGCGCVTLLWLLKHRPGMIEDFGYDSAGTIVDYVVAGLGDLERPVTSDILADSMGYFNCVKKTWNTDILKSAGFPTSMLPSLSPLESVVGHLPRQWNNIRKGVPVYVGMGDTQCAFRSVSHGPNEAVLNIGTSVQFGYVISDPHFDPYQRPPDTPAGLQYRPYFDGCYIATYMGKNGGNVLHAFVRMVRSWCQDFGVEISESEIWTKLRQLALETVESELIIDAELFGTYLRPTPSCNIRGITPFSLSVAQIFQALCRSIVDQVHSAMNGDYLQRQDISVIRTAGFVPSTFPCLSQRLEQLYNVHTVVHGSSSDASLGAARVVKKNVNLECV